MRSSTPQSADVVDDAVTALGNFEFDFGACNATSCPDGCCSTTGACEVQSDTACGRGGDACIDCTNNGEACTEALGICE